MPTKRKKLPLCTYTYIVMIQESFLITEKYIPMLSAEQRHHNGCSTTP